MEKIEGLFGFYPEGRKSCSTLSIKTCLFSFGGTMKTTSFQIQTADCLTRNFRFQIRKKLIANRYSSTGTFQSFDKLTFLKYRQRTASLEFCCQRQLRSWAHYTVSPFRMLEQFRIIQKNFCSLIKLNGLSEDKKCLGIVKILL